MDEIAHGCGELPNWKLVEIAARELAKRSPDGTFTRKQIIDYINNVLLKGLKPRKPSSLNPVIQGVTANAPGGAPSSIGKNLLWRVSRGRYRLFDPQKDKPLPEKSPEASPMPRAADRCVLKVGQDGSLIIPAEMLRAAKIGASSSVLCLVRDRGLIIRPLPDIYELLDEEPEVWISVEEFLAHRRELSARLET